MSSRSIKKNSGHQGPMPHIVCEPGAQKTANLTQGTRQRGKESPQGEKKNRQVHSLTSNEGTTTVIVYELDKPQGSSLSQETIAKTDNEQACSLTENKVTTRVVI